MGTSILQWDGSAKGAPFSNFAGQIVQSAPERNPLLRWLAQLQFGSARAPVHKIWTIARHSKLSDDVTVRSELPLNGSERIGQDSAVIELDNLTEILKALAWDFHDQSDRRSFTDFFNAAFVNRGVAKTTFYNALIGKPPTGRALPKLVEAIRGYIADREINVDAILQRHRHAHPPITAASTLPDVMRGAWYAIMYRAKRVSVTENPAEDFRVGVLVYGHDNADERAFQIVGQNTLWEGNLRQQDGHYALTARETTASNVRESVTLLMHEIHPQASVVYHHGIATGVGRGEHDQRDFPIFASRVLLWRIKTVPQSYTTPLDPNQIEGLRIVCGYFSAEEYEQLRARDDLDAPIKERNEAIRVFRDLSSIPENYGNGNRLLIRR